MYFFQPVVKGTLTCLEGCWRLLLCLIVSTRLWNIYQFLIFLTFWGRLCDEACIKGHDGSSMPNYTTIRMHRTVWHMEDVPWVPSSEKSLKLQLRSNIGRWTVPSFTNHPLPGRVKQQIRRFNGIWTCYRATATATLYWKCAGKTLVLGASEEGPHAWRHEACVECTSSWRSIPRAKFLSPSSSSSRIGLVSAALCYRKKKSSAFPCSKAKPENTTSACLSGAADTINVIIKSLSLGWLLTAVEGVIT